MSLSKKTFSLVMSSPGGPGGSRHGEWVNITPKDIAKLKIALTGVRSIVRESLAKRTNLILLTLYFLLKLTYFLAKSVYRQFEKIN